jgi:hypothetical protein
MQKDGRLKVERHGGKRVIVSPPNLGSARNITGRRFGALVVESFTGDKNYLEEPLWNVRCDCGRMLRISGSALRRGLSENCGCGLAGARPAKRRMNRLPETEIRALYVAQQGRCPLSGLPLELTAPGRNISVDCQAGHARLLHRDIKRMKMALSETDFIRLCRLVAEQSYLAPEASSANRLPRFSPGPSLEFPVSALALALAE